MECSFAHIFLGASSPVTQPGNGRSFTSFVFALFLCEKICNRESNNKPSIWIWEWFIPPIYGALGGWFIIVLPTLTTYCFIHCHSFFKGSSTTNSQGLDPAASAVWWKCPTIDHRGTNTTLASGNFWAIEHGLSLISLKDGDVPQPRVYT